jgi:hypothetical protein
MLRYLGLSVLLLSAASVQAAEDAPPAPVPPPPAMSDSSDGSNTVDEVPVLKPDITIRQEKEQTVEEYRINGRLYKVKIIPKHGKPYYLLYPNGPQGQPIRRELGELQTPYWVIFSW